VIVDPIRNCEILLRRALQEIQTASDMTRLASLYEDAKQTLTSLLIQGELQPDSDAQRGIMSLMLYAHLAYRTKEADCAQSLRILAVR
jgi:hypothetical protein